MEVSEISKRSTPDVHHKTSTSSQADMVTKLFSQLVSNTQSRLANVENTNTPKALTSSLEETESSSDSNSVSSSQNYSSAREKLSDLSNSAAGQTPQVVSNFAILAAQDTSSSSDTAAKCFQPHIDKQYG